MWQLPLSLTFWMIFSRTLTRCLGSHLFLSRGQWPCGLQGNTETLTGARAQQPASVFPQFPRSSLFPSGKLSALYLFAGRCCSLSLRSWEAMRESWFGDRTSPAWSCHGSSQGPREGVGAPGEAGLPPAPCSAVSFHVRGPRSEKAPFPCPAARPRGAVHGNHGCEGAESPQGGKHEPQLPSLRLPCDLAGPRGLHRCQIPSFFQARRGSVRT